MKGSGESGFAGSTGSVSIRYRKKEKFPENAVQLFALGTKKRASYLFIR
jgi:hypothetical protein